ncbi:MAG: DUF1566 domain-containing protein [Desulfobacterales bacterium]|nr:DUF1566 domain-containing protein [Desulfobacterales bacterium]
MIKLLYFTLILALSGLPGAVNAADQTCKSEIPASTPTSRFTDHGNGTVTDTQTELMWAKCPHELSGSGCATGSLIWYNWKEALDLADSSELAGYDDWRLPNIKELRSIVEEQCYSPAINLLVFPNTPAASNFWSASPVAPNSRAAWNVHFGFGYSVLNARKDNFNVRLVRSGSSSSG